MLVKCVKIILEGDYVLVNSNEILGKALKEGYAVPAYNINNLEWTRFILEECNKDKAPVILGVSESAISYMGGFKTVVNLVKNLISDLNISIPVVLHLDHGKSVDACKKAIDAGFTSVMLDASSKSFDENVSETIEVISYSKSKNVSVEAEIGSLNGEVTNLDEAKDFVIQTGVDSLAPSIGNLHGIYTGEVNLDFDLLGGICKNTKVPLVLHGASGLDENKIKTAIFCGVSKININTDLQIAWSNSVRKFLNYDSNAYDPRVIIKSGELALKKEVHKKNELFGCINKAN